jgi:hypothetical protein
VLVKEGAHEMAEATVPQRFVEEDGRLAQRHRPAAAAEALGGLGEHRHPLGVGGRGVMEVHEERQVPLSVDQVGQDVVELRRPGMVELAVDGDDHGSLIAADDDAGAGGRRPVVRPL